MTDLKDQLARLLDNEPDAPSDIDRILHRGRRARWRHNAALATAGTVGAAGLTAAIVIPVMATGGNEAPGSVGARPSPPPTSGVGNCYYVAGPPKAAKHDVTRLIRSGKVGRHSGVKTVKGRPGDHRTSLEVCAHGTSSTGQGQGKDQGGKPPAGPPYHYTDKPQTIASRLGAHLHDRVSALGLSVTYTRPFSQESSTLESGRPSYFDGNVDVHETSGYGDIGVQVRHAVTQLVPFTGACTAAHHCTQTKLTDGSVLRTGRVDAGQGDVILTAELHRPDGVIVQAQESDYPFGPDAGSQPHGRQPLTLHQLVTLAEDNAFTF